MRVESMGEGNDTPGFQDKYHEVNRNEGKYDDTRKISDKYIPEEIVHLPQIIIPTEWRIYNLMLIKPSNYYKHPRVDNYAHT